jgi:hypothetical protein
MVKTLEIPDHYAEIGVQRGWDPTPLQQMRVWLLAAPGGGKTHFSASNPHAIIWDAEKRARDVVSGEAYHVHFPTVEEWLKLLELMEQDAGKTQFKHVVIDTIDAFQEQVMDYLTKREGEDVRDLGSRGKGWYVIRDFICKDILGRLERAGYGWTVTGHLKQVVHEQKNGQVRIYNKPSVQDSLITALFTRCHIQATMLRTTETPIRIKKVKTKRGTHEVEERLDPVTKFYMSMRPGDGDDDREARDGKNPYLGYLDEYIELPANGGWAAVEAAYDAAMDKARAEHKGGQQ